MSGENVLISTVGPTNLMTNE